eukprot:3501682-Amphidinium_carterae.1
MLGLSALQAETELNDYYLRIILPSSMFSSPNPEGDSRAAIRITLPLGYTCKGVRPAVARELEDGTQELLP